MASAVIGTILILQKMLISLLATGPGPKPSSVYACRLNTISLQEMFCPQKVKKNNNNNKKKKIIIIIIYDELLIVSYFIIINK